jgi:hypothetical protein
MSTATQFEPITDPLSLSPEEFVARARERGLTFKRTRKWWIPEDKCGCFLGVATVLGNPRLERRVIGQADVQDALDFVGSELRESILGFDGLPQESHDPESDAAYAKGQAVARAAGLEEGEGKA